MRKLTFFLTLLLAATGLQVKADNVLLEGPGTLANEQYTFESGTLFSGSDTTKVIRLVFLDTVNHETSSTNYRHVAIGELYLTDGSGTSVTLTADNVSTNAQETAQGEGPTTGLFDGITTDNSTYTWYWHSKWSGASSDGNFHYLQIAVPNNASLSNGFKLKWISRRVQAAPSTVLVITGQTAESVQNQYDALKTGGSAITSITALTELSNTTPYYLEASEGAKRGAYYYNGKNASYLYTTGYLSINGFAADPNQQFLLIKSPSGKTTSYNQTTYDVYYAYNVGAKKFIAYAATSEANTGRVALQDDPAAVIFKASGSGYSAAPFVLSFNNGANDMGISNSYTYGAITFYNSVTDGGNCTKIVPVTGATVENAADVIQYVKDFEEYGEVYDPTLAHLNAYVSYNSGADGVDALSDSISKYTIADGDATSTKVSKTNKLKALLASLPTDADIPNKVMNSQDGLPGSYTAFSETDASSTTQTGSVYKWTSPLLTVPEGTTKLRLTVTTTNTAAKYGDHVFFTMSELYLYDASGNKLTLSADGITSNAQASNEGSIANLVDGLNSTFFHSAYSGSGTADPGEDHYLELTLPSAITSLKVGFDSRSQNGNNVPTTIIVTPIDTKAEAKEALQEMVKLATYTNGEGWEIGTRLNSYVSTEAYTTALAAANTALENASATENDYTTATTNLETACKALKLNQPADGTFLRVRATALNQSTMPYLLSANSTYKTTRAAFGDGGTASSIFYYKDGKFINFENGYYIANNTNDGSGFLFYDSSLSTGTSIAFTEAANGTTGCYNVLYKDDASRALYAMSATSDNVTYIYADGGGKTALGNGYNFWLEDVSTFPVSVSSAGFATLYMPVAVNIPTGVTAYTATRSGDYLVLTALSGVIPANQPVILEASEDSYNFTLNTENTDAANAGALTGVLATAAHVNGSYTLQQPDGEEVGFYLYNDTDTNYMKGFKAYVAGSVASGAHALLFQTPATGIVSAGNAVQAPKAIYDLQGRRVSRAVKGVYVIDGQKVIVK